MVSHFRIEKNISDSAFIDGLEIHSCSLIRISGWVNQADSIFNGITVRVNNVDYAPDVVYRTYRADLGDIINREGFDGFEMEWFFPELHMENVQLWCESALGDKEQLFGSNGISINTYIPDYIHLRNGGHVYGRSQIYGSGPPVDHVDGNVLNAINGISGKVLDFGCGKGALIKEMKKRHIDAYGIEVERPDITAAITEDMSKCVQLYDGSMPLPFENDQFDYVTCIEVLEHIPDVYKEALFEISRVARKGILLTVPDMSSVPLLHKFGVVPWHLLESTHYNFFNAITLIELLKRSFSKVELRKIGAFEINGTRCYTSLMAFCEK